MPATARLDRKGTYDLDKMSPRVRLAARLYGTAVCKTKKEASIAAGLHPNYLTLLTGKASGSEKVRDLIDNIDEAINDESISTSILLQRLGRRAIGNIARAMKSDNEHVALKAAVDLADRSPETSKTQKVSIESFSLDGADVKALASAMVESAKVAVTYQRAGVEGLIEIETDTIKEPVALPSTVSPSEEKSS